jgi:hypothetical protein
MVVLAMGVRAGLAEGAAGNCGSRELPYADLRKALEAAGVYFEA